MEFVSRDSLVEEITGIKKDDMAWDSAKVLADRLKFIQKTKGYIL